MKNKTELLKEIQTISRKATEWKERYESQCFWTILSVIVNIALTLALIGRYL